MTTDFDELSQLAQSYGSDKTGSHFYTQHYATHFAAMRGKPIHLLEIGIGGYADPDAGGASLRMWRDYFGKAQICGLDFHTKTIDEDRIQVFQGSQTDPLTIARILGNVPGGRFDIIVDDGSHRSEHVICSFMMLFQFLNVGGWYVVEDTQTSYWPKFGGGVDPHSNRLTTMSFFKELIDGLNWEEIHQPGYMPKYTDLSVSEIHFYHNLIFVRKGENREGSNFLSNNTFPQWLVSP